MHSQLLSEHASSHVETAVLAGHSRPLEGLPILGIPKILAAWLEWWPGPATSLLEYLSGSKLHLHVIRTGWRHLGEGDRDHYALDAAGLVRCRWRHAVLVTDTGWAAAAVSLLWLPARLPWDTCTLLDAGEEPAGRILDRLPGGMQRAERRAVAASTLEEITGQQAAVSSTAVLAAGGHRVAIAEEWVLRDFAESLAHS